MTRLIFHFELIETVEPLVSDILHVAHNVVQPSAQASLELLQLRRLALEMHKKRGRNTGREYRGKYRKEIRGRNTGR